MTSPDGTPTVVRGVRFFVPYVDLADIKRPEVAAAAPVGTRFVDVSGSPLAYHEMLANAWADCLVAGDDLAIIEHDVICHGSVAEQFASCPEPWCLFGYDNMCHDACREAWANQLGCTRFRHGLIAAVPDAVTSIPPGALQDWHNLCDGLGGYHPAMPEARRSEVVRSRSLRGAGFSHHWHAPPVSHHPWFVNR